MVPGPGFITAVVDSDSGGIFTNSAAGVVLIPAFPLVKMILLSPVINGVLLPVVLTFMIILINKRDLMQE